MMMFCARAILVVLLAGFTAAATDSHDPQAPRAPRELGTQIER